jgi:tetratricopeptide (TPR) repeat protein
MRRRFIFAVALPSILSLTARAHQKPWIEVRSPHFRVLTNGSQNDGRRVAKEFEQMRYVFADRYPEFRLEGGAPLTIFAPLDEATAKSLEPAVWKEKGAKPAGIFHHGYEREYAMVRLDTMGGEGAREIVYHEYTHTILHLNLHWLPVWLDEGLANFYGYTRFEEHKILVGAPPARYGMPRGTLIPIETLISVEQGSSYYRDEDKVYQFYAESWALVHFLIFGPGMERGKRLNQFATLLQQGVEQKKAFQQTLGNFKAVDHDLSDYLSKLSFQTRVLPDTTQIDEKTFSAGTMSVAQTEAELAGFHLWTRDIEGARSLAEQAIKDDAKLALAHENMGFADFSEGKDVEALTEFSQARALDPSLALSLFAKTMMSPLATSDAEADEDAFSAALLQVLSLNPQFAQGYVQLALLALRRNDPRTAFGLSRKAEQLDPSLAGYHTLSGEILLRLGRGGEAASFAKFVAQRWPGPDHDEAVELWDAIPADERPAGNAPTLTPILPKDTQLAEGIVASVHCSGAERNIVLVLNRDGRTLAFHGNGRFPGGFSDTIWYGADHFSFCHHLEGQRAIVQYRAPSDGSYAGDLTEVDIRNDLPGASSLRKISAASSAATVPKP